MTKEENAPAPADTAPADTAPAAKDEEIPTHWGLFDEPKEDQAPGADPAPTPDAVAKEEKKFTASKSREFDLLAKKERELVQRQQQLKAMESQLEQLNRIKNTAKQSPLEALKQLEVDPADLVSHILGEKADPEPEPDKHVLAVKQELEALKRQVVEAQENAVYVQEVSALQQVIGQMDVPVLRMLADDGEDIPNLIRDAAYEHKKRTGEFPDIAALIQKEEQQRSAALEAGIKRLKSVGKFQGLFGPTAPAAKKTKTLVNAMQSEPAARDTGDFTEDDFIQTIRKAWEE